VKEVAVVEEEIHLPPVESQTEVTAAQNQTPPDATSEGPSGQALEGERAPSPRRRRRRKRRPNVDLSHVQPGQQYQGRVVGLAQFGAFVDIGLGRDGLIHISELGQDFVDKVDNVVAVGDEVTVWVKSVDQKRSRISLTMIEPHGQPLSLKELEPGMVLEGTVEGVASFGAFVDIGAPVNGLVHVSEMAESYVRRPQSLVSPGDDVKVRVLEVDQRHRKISLSMKGFYTPDVPSQGDREPALTAMQFAWQQALAAKKAEEGAHLTVNPKDGIIETVEPQPDDDGS
jgi:small subunit ribosomal protein S1